METNASYAVDDAEDLREALGIGKSYPYRGRDYDLKALDLFDMMELMRKFGSMTRIDLAGDPEAVLYTVWFVLRKADPDLSASDRSARRWTMSIDAAASLFSLDQPEGTLEFLNAIKNASGLLGNKDPQEAAEQKKTLPAAVTPRKRRRPVTPGAA